jgi:hypothetical protein
MEFAMPKSTKMPQASGEKNGRGVELTGTGSVRVSGGTMTSWSGPPHFDPTETMAEPSPKAPTLGFASGLPQAVQDERRHGGTVTLSDGTHITFVTGPL